jgi:putative transposon-encoded protein
MISVRVKKDLLNVSPELFFEGVVTKFGSSGGHIVFKQKFVGKKVYVIVRE